MTGEKSIRDVVINVSVQAGEMKLGGIDLSQFNESLDKAAAAIKNQSFSLGGVGGGGAGAGVDKLADAIEKASSAKNQARMGASDNDLASLWESVKARAAEINEAKNLKNELAEVEEKTNEAAAAQLKLNESQLKGAAVLAILAVGLKGLSIALTEAKELNRQYWENNATDAENSFHRQAATTVRQAKERRALFESDIDTTRAELAPERAERGRQREGKIRFAQDQIRERPLAERQEIRTRIEQQGANFDEAEELRARIARGTSRSDEISRLRGGIAIKTANVEDAQQAHANRLAEVKENTNKPTRLGIALEQSFKHDINKLSFGLMNPSRSTAADKLAGAFGGVTPAMADEKNFELKERDLKSSIELQKTSTELKQEDLKLAEQERTIKGQTLETSVRLLSVLRDEAKQSRMNAEAGKEDLTNTMLRFGKADEGTKASLRVIQAKADRGEKLNFQEMNLADSFQIDASRQARTQALDSANDPKNAGLFTNKVELQKGREERAAHGEADLNREEPAIQKAIGEGRDSVKQSSNDIRELLQGISDVAKVVDGLEDDYIRTKENLDRFLKKNRQYIGS